MSMEAIPLPCSYICEGLATEDVVGNGPQIERDAGWVQQA
jgi:hypothetical protein